MLSSKKANELAWIVFLTFVLSFPVLCDYKIGQGHLRSPGKKGQTNKKSGLRAVIHVFRSDFRKEREQ